MSAQERTTLVQLDSLEDSPSLAGYKKSIIVLGQRGRPAPHDALVLQLRDGAPLPQSWGTDVKTTEPAVAAQATRNALVSLRTLVVKALNTPLFELLSTQPETLPYRLLADEHKHVKITKAAKAYEDAVTCIIDTSKAKADLWLAKQYPVGAIISLVPPKDLGDRTHEKEAKFVPFVRPIGSSDVEY